MRDAVIAGVCANLIASGTDWLHPDSAKFVANMNAEIQTWAILEASDDDSEPHSQKKRRAEPEDTEPPAKKKRTASEEERTISPKELKTLIHSGLLSAMRLSKSCAEMAKRLDPSLSTDYEDEEHSSQEE